LPASEGGDDGKKIKIKLKRIVWACRRKKGDVNLKNFKLLELVEAKSLFDQANNKLPSPYDYSVI